MCFYLLIIFERASVYSEKFSKEFLRKAAVICIPAVFNFCPPFSYPTFLGSMSSRAQVLDSKGPQYDANKFNSNKRLYNEVFGTVTSMHYNSNPESYAEELNRLRLSWKSVSKRAKEVFISSEETEKEIRSLVSKAGDLYAYYASPSEVKPEAYRKGESFATSAKSTLGISLKPVVGPNLGSTLIGAEITAVYSKSSCERAGLKVGDIILEVNNIPLSSSSVKMAMPMTLASAKVREMGFAHDGVDYNELDLQKSLERVLEGDYNSIIRLGILPRPGRDSPYLETHISSSTPKTGLYGRGGNRHSAPPLQSWTQSPIYSYNDNSVYHVSLQRDQPSSSVLKQLPSDVLVEELRDPSLPLGATVAYIRLFGFRCTS